MRLSLIFLFLSSVISQGSSCFGLTISIDYTGDAATASFFSANPLAEAAVNQAAADISALLAPTQLTAIGPTGTPNVDAISGTSGSTTVTADWDLIYTNPVTGATVTMASPSLATNTVKIYVYLDATGAGTLGEGGPVGASLSLGAGGFGSQLAAAMSAMQSASNSYMGRGAGPVIATFSGTMTLGSNSSNFNLTYGPTAGVINFNNDSDGNGTTDSQAQMNNYWQFDSTKPVAAGKADFYSVALHEILHGLGLGTSETWDSLVSGNTWLGANAVALNGGSGAGLVSIDGGHIADGTMSTNIFTGDAQEAAMDPSLTVGTRKGLTEMDVAFLEDLGYTVASQYAVVPEPGGAAFALTALICSVVRRRRSR